jgi:two-component system chemotaxis response regulator CheY
MKLLIVDDSLIVRNLIERNARHPEIHEIHRAANGAEALALYQQLHPELVTMDLTMPELDGLECLEKVQSFGRPVSVLVISAINSHRTAMDAIARGACGFLTKPFTPEELLEALGELVDHAKAVA